MFPSFFMSKRLCEVNRMVGRKTILVSKSLGVNPVNMVILIETLKDTLIMQISFLLYSQYYTAIKFLQFPVNKISPGLTLNRKRSGLYQTQYRNFFSI